MLHAGLAIAPWNVLAAGRIRSDAQEEERRKTGEKGRTMLSPNWERTEEEKRVARVLEEVAAEVGAPTIQAGTHAFLAAAQVERS